MNAGADCRVRTARVTAVNACRRGSWRGPPGSASRSSQTAEPGRRHEKQDRRQEQKISPRKTAPTGRMNHHHDEENLCPRRDPSSHHRNQAGRTQTSNSPTFANTTPAMGPGLKTAPGSGGCLHRLKPLKSVPAAILDRHHEQTKGHSEAGKRHQPARVRIHKDHVKARATVRR